jgi:hypothetical protein
MRVSKKSPSLKKQLTRKASKAKETRRKASKAKATRSKASKASKASNTYLLDACLEQVALVEEVTGSQAGNVPLA